MQDFNIQPDSKGWKCGNEKFVTVRTSSINVPENITDEEKEAAREYIEQNKERLI